MKIYIIEGLTEEWKKTKINIYFRGNMGLPAESLALQLARTDQGRRRIWKLCYVERHITVKTNHQVVNRNLHVFVIKLIMGKFVL